MSSTFSERICKEEKRKEKKKERDRDTENKMEMESEGEKEGRGDEEWKRKREKFGVPNKCDPLGAEEFITVCQANATQCRTLHFQV